MKLNSDGTRKLDAEGQPIPTYDNTDIREFSRIFTGLAYAGDAGQDLNLAATDRYFICRW